MSTSDESLWAMYAAAAVTAGHRSAAAIDEIATEAVALHRRRFPLASNAPDDTPFGGASGMNKPSHPPESHTYPSAASTTTSERPAKGKDSR